MAIKEPASIDECYYYTKRDIGKGHVKAWVYKQKCAQCEKALMGKPKDQKTGKPKIRSQEYQCPECKHTIPKEKYEEQLNTEIKYHCPHCRHEGETQVPFKRKKVKVFNEEKQKEVAVEAIIFKCEKCNEKIEISKKMK